MTTRIRRRLSEWGNGYGIRITKSEARKLGLRPGDTVDIEVQGEAGPNDVASLPVFHLGGTYEIDAILEDDADAGP